MSNNQNNNQNQQTGQEPEQSSPALGLNKNVLIWGVLLGSFVEMWAAIAICAQLDNGSGAAYGTSSRDCHGKFAWAVACGLIGLLLAATLVVLGKFKATLLDGCVGWIMYGVLFFLWGVGMVVGTMEAPFAPSGSSVFSNSYGVAGNGYVGTWMALFFSTLLFFGHAKPVTELMKKVFGDMNTSNKLLLAIFLASVVEFWHAARICDDVDQCKGMLAWGVSVGILSCFYIVAFVLLVRFVPSFKDYVKFFGAFIALWWIVAVCTLTMPNGEESCSGGNYFCQGLFLSASNGFFGTWVAMLLSVVLTAQLFGLELPGSDTGAGAGSTQASEEGEGKARPSGTATPADPAAEPAAATPAAEPTAEDPQSGASGAAPASGDNQV